MKKFIFSLLAFMFVLPVAFGLVACGNKEETKTLTKEEVVGVWYSTKVVIAGGEYDGEYTYARYQELKAIDEGTTRELEEDEPEEYFMLNRILQNFKLEEGVGDAKGKVYRKELAQADTYYSETATWEIVNNEVKIYVDDEGISSITWARDGDLAIVTITFTDNETNTYTLAKVPQE